MTADDGELPDSFLKYVEENPLLMFSPYTDSQVRAVRELGERIIGTLDSGISNRVDSEKFLEIYGLFWFWVLGAYEIVRTMVEADEHLADGCFSASFRSKLDIQKEHLARIRIPFAKQELRKKVAKKATPVSNELSVTRFDIKRKDFSFSIEGANVSVRETILAFERTFDSARPDDILADHRASYPRSKAKRRG